MSSTSRWLVVAALVGVAADQPARADKQARNPKVDAKADQILRKMAADLSTLKSFQFDADHATEVVTTEGQKLQFLAKSRVRVQRPNKLRSERTGPLADIIFIYDGANVTIYGKRLNLYASTRAPHKLDDAIDFTRDELDIDAPAADLLYHDVYPTLMEDVVSGTYLGTEEVGDRSCHHLAYRGNETDWQIWIEDGPRALPCRYLITSKKVKESPQYTVEFSDWRIDPAFSADTFVFTPPDGAVKIDFMFAHGAAPNIR